jgi:predicted AAA+ superfamily ATPase
MAQVRDVVVTQRREIELRLQERYVERDIGPRPLSRDLINVVIGPRRAGKSFAAMHLIRDMGPFGYLNFDDERLAQLEDHDELLAAADNVYGAPEFLLLDEVQNLPRWQLLVNRLQRQGRRLTITGSNAHLLSSELATHLTGRHMQVVLLPFSFGEYLRSRSAGRLTEAEQVEALRAYVEVGGYPEPLLKDVARRDYLATLMRSVLYKDIVVRHEIRVVRGLDDLAQYLLANVAQEYSYNTLADVTRLNAVGTVQKYLDHLEEAFLFFLLPRFSFKVREQVKSPRKVYCIDNGLVTAAAFRFSADLGKLYENAVAVALHKRELQGDAEVFFWKGPQQQEVDFVVKRGLEVTNLIQVCASVDNPKTRQREIRALLKASDALRCDELLVLTENTEAEEEVSWYGHGGVVRFVPLWRWLLEAA